MARRAWRSNIPAVQAAVVQKAKKLGYKIWVHLDYVAGHNTTQDLKENFYDQLAKYKVEKELFMLKKKMQEDKPRYLDKLLREVKESSLLKIGDGQDTIQ